jgi:ATP-binding cassette subfamily B protein
MASVEEPAPVRGFWPELCTIVRCALQTWRLVPARHKVALGIAAGVMAVTSVCGTGIPLLLGSLVDRVQHNDGQTAGELAFQTASYYLGIIALLYLFRELLHVLRRYLVENSCTRIERDMKVRLIAHLMKVDLHTFTRVKVGALNGRISRSVDGFVRFLRLIFLDFFPAILTGVFALAAALGKQPWLGLVMLGVAPLSVLLTVWQLISQKGVRLQLMRSKEGLDGTVVELLGGIDYVRAANSHEHEVNRVRKAADRQRVKELRHHFQMSLFGCAKALNEGLFHIMVIGLAVYLALTGSITFGDILTFSILFLNVMAPLNEIHRVIDTGHESSLQVSDLLDLLAQPVDRSFALAERRQPGLVEEVPLLVCDGVRAEYLTQEGTRKVALDGVSLSIRRGEKVGIAGRSGCGKSTWVRVLLRLTHPCGGTVTLGGVPLEHVPREVLADLIGYVGQSPFIFAGTIEENIAYGCKTADEAAIHEAARLASIHDEILQLTNGYQTEVTERGQNLSGGQRQRIALARVFLKNPPILILDEATSALDAINERNVQRAIEAARADRTVIHVAHRLSSLAKLDRIIVFDDGRIAEAGTYQELMRTGGVFNDLARTALEGQELEPVPIQAPGVQPVTIEHELALCHA